MAPKLSGVWPVLTSYDQSHLARIALPLGGIGTGTVSLGGRGDLRDWEIVNRPAKGFSPKNAFFALWAQPAGPSGSASSPGTRHAARGTQSVTRCLEGILPPETYEGGFGCPQPNHGLPRFRRCTFHAAYPFGQVLLGDPDVPLDVRLEAFNPLIPGDPDRSGLPVAILRFVLANRTERAVDAAVCGSLQNFIGADGSNGKPVKNVNTFRTQGKLRGVFMASEGVDPKAEQWGTMALATLPPSVIPSESEEPSKGASRHGRTGSNHGTGSPERCFDRLSMTEDRSGAVTHRTAWAKRSWGDSLLDFWDDFSADGQLDDRAAEGVDDPTASLAVRLRIPARSERAVTFLLAWHFPNRMTWTPVKDACCEANRVGNYYATQFADAWDAASRAAAALPRLEADTLAFARAFCDSDLPHAVKEAALCTLTALRSQTSFRTEDGRFFGWEGCGDKSGCCHGSCTHVWNYEHATAFLFPTLARSMRETEFLLATDEAGRMAFRVNLPLARAQEFPHAAADGQLGCLMKAYRDWQLSGDDAWLRRLWPHIRKAIEFCWIPGGWDADRDGVMEGCQHNTMDVEYYGPNPQMGAWYLGALRAVEEMARHLGETDLAATCRGLFERGRRWMDEHLFNGEYYEHEVRPPKSPDDIAPGLRLSMGAANLAEPDLQLGAGCLVDQLVGQYTAHVLGLGYLLDPKHVKATHRAIFKHNFRRHLHGHFNHLRTFALNDEAALLMATYPRGRRPKRPFPYYNEVMTGFEYCAAVGMLYEGQTANGLRCIEAIRARYDGRRRSPFDEAECGHHYARAMAAWSAVPALTGFHYSAVGGTLTFAAADSACKYARPARSSSSSSSSSSSNSTTWFWSTGSAWGTIRQRPSREAIEIELAVLHGELQLRRLTIAGAGSSEWRSARSLRAKQRMTVRIPTS